MIPVIPAARSRVISLWYCLAVHGIVVPLGWRKVELITGDVVASAATGDRVSEARAAVASTPAAAMVEMIGSLMLTRSAGQVAAWAPALVQNGCRPTRPARCSGRVTRSGVMTGPHLTRDPDCAHFCGRFACRQLLGRGAWVPWAAHWSGAPRLGLSVAARANDSDGLISPGLITPSSIAWASSASFLGADRPVAAYLARARLMYCRTVFSLIFMRRPTDAFDMPWNHSSSAWRSCSDSWGRAGCWSASIARAWDRVTYGRSAAAASTASTRCSLPSSLDT